MVRLAVHGAAGVGAAVCGHRRRAVSGFRGEGMVAHHGLSLRQSGASLFPRQHLFQEDGGERPEGVLGQGQRLGDGRAGARAAISASESSRPRALRAVVQGHVGQDSDVPAAGRPVAREFARPRELSAQGNERFGLLHLRANVGRESGVAGPGAVRARRAQGMGGAGRLRGGGRKTDARPAHRRGPEEI